MYQLGGKSIVVNSNDMQLNRGETISDTAKVLSRYVDIVMLRTNEHSSILDFSESSSVPVINGLSDLSHPCQVVADLMTFEEILGLKFLQKSSNLQQPDMGEKDQINH